MTAKIFNKQHAHAFVAGGLLILFLAQAGFVAYKKNSTWDEPAHILAGYGYLTHGMDYLSPLHHPVLGRSLTAFFPAVFLDLDFDEKLRPEEEAGSDFFPYSVSFIYKNRASGKTILFLGRIANILVAMMLGLYVYRWSKELWGVTGALMSLFLYALCPNVLAHSALATTDLPITAFFFISTYHLYKSAVSGPTLQNTALAGVFLAFAFTTKHTAILLIPVFAASLVLRLRSDADRGKTVLHYAAMILIVYAGIWAVYGLRYRMEGPAYIPLFWERFSGSFFKPLFLFLRSWKILPEAYLYGMSGVISGAGAGKSAFLMGEYSQDGWWHYFLVAFLIKTPIAIIVFLIASVLYVSFDRDSRAAAMWAVLPAALVFIVMSMQKVNIGLRHILPVYPFIFLVCGYVPRIKTVSLKTAKAAFTSFLLWYAYAGFSITPHQLAYFNEFVGGPESGYKYLVDSNLDWGQDLSGLKDYMDSKDIRRIKLAYFGLNDPSDFGIDYEYLPSYAIVNPKEMNTDVRLAGWFAISATMLQGVYLKDKGLYAIFRDMKPEAVIGHTIFVYRFPPG